MENKTEQKKKGVFLADAHPMVRYGLKHLINQQRDIEVRGEADELNEALALIGTTHVDILVVDLLLRGASGIELIKALKQTHSTIVPLVFSIYDEPFYVRKAFAAGAHGYLSKTESLETFLIAVRQVLSGESYLSENMKIELIEPPISGHTKFEEKTSQQRWSF